ncbi:MAG: phosphotransferase [Patescibacteria group bacterium]|nr:phosphotransferase [Patescibacteria group bacterium]
MDPSLFTPEIVKKIESILNKLRLVPETAPREFIKKTDGRKHRYFSVCKNKIGQKIMFYARLYKSLSDKKRMVNEIKLGKFFGENSLADFFPKYILSGIKKEFEWIVREYFSTQSLERERQIERLRKKLRNKDISNIVEKLQWMNNLPVSPFGFLEKFNLKEYFSLSEKISRENFLTEKEIRQIENIVRENEAILKMENKYFCHGDFHIGNIIFSEKLIKFIDLESVHINNFAFDIAFLTTRLWQNLKERKMLIKSYFQTLPVEKKKTLPSLFRINAAYIGYNAFMSEPVEYSLKMIGKRRTFYKKLIRAAAKSFGKVVNL